MAQSGGSGVPTESGIASKVRPQLLLREVRRFSGGFAAQKLGWQITQDLPRGVTRRARLHLAQNAALDEMLDMA